MGMQSGKDIESKRGRERQREHAHALGRKDLLGPLTSFHPSTRGAFLFGFTYDGEKRCCLCNWNHLMCST